MGSSGSCPSLPPARSAARGERRALVPAARRSVWTTDKDGIILALLASETRGDRVVPLAVVPRPHRRLRRARLRPHLEPSGLSRRPESCAGQGPRPTRSPPASSRAKKITEVLATAPGIARTDRRYQGPTRRTGRFAACLPASEDVLTSSTRVLPLPRPPGRLIQDSRARGDRRSSPQRQGVMNTAREGPPVPLGGRGGCGVAAHRLRGPAGAGVGLRARSAPGLTSDGGPAQPGCAVSVP